MGSGFGSKAYQSFIAQVWKNLSLRLSSRHFGNPSGRRYGPERYGFALLYLVSIVKKPIEDTSEIDLVFFYSMLGP